MTAPLFVVIEVRDRPCNLWLYRFPYHWYAYL